MEREVICLLHEHIIIVSLEIQRKQTEARAPTVLWTAATNTHSKSPGISNECLCFSTQRVRKSDRAGERENDIDNHFNLCLMTHRPRPGFFGPRPGFDCIDNATFRVEEALAAAGPRRTEGGKQDEVCGDIVALRRRSSRLLLRKEASGFIENPTHHPSCARASHPDNADTPICSEETEGKKKE
jgi:hypothetical protein